MQLVEVTHLWDLSTSLCNLILLLFNIPLKYFAIVYQFCVEKIFRITDEIASESFATVVNQVEHCIVG